MIVNFNRNHNISRILVKDPRIPKINMKVEILHYLHQISIIYQVPKHQSLVLKI